MLFFNCPSSHIPFVLFVPLLIFFLSPLDQRHFHLFHSFISQNHTHTKHGTTKILPTYQLLNITTETSISLINNVSEEKVLKKKSGLEEIELGLARARASIRRAVTTRNYTSYKEENYVPRGAIYRNAYAFHQSHIEMERRFKVWTYKEGEPPLIHEGPCHSIYSVEGQFINEMESGRSPFSARHPHEAHAFFLPVSIANVISLVNKPSKSYSRDPLQHLVTDYISIISNKYPYWNRSQGADHFLVSCHDWAPDVSRANPMLFNNLIRVLCNANTSEGFQPKRDVAIPEINIIHYDLLPTMDVGQSPSNRSILAFFAGGAHGHIRELILEHWKDKDDEVQVHDSLPVGQNWSQFSVQIPIDRIEDIKAILQNITLARYLMLQARVIDVQRHFLLNRPAQSFDLTHMVLHSIWLRRLNLRLPY
ncbi:putative glycosyltransferase isoform X1 [Cinnamomum micranthum f. kanehirae]|uniref:Putative glycosyltransferase isoform X1 n=1 Tax=Cinnamomum micranthum f. kanehirae TaxID=337451 RepID=A0A3S3NFN9_9MAGN|nr:putative glycosyltransferase isoform X1 [Cinnamomum micranthum f. kanehirae]